MILTFYIITIQKLYLFIHFLKQIINYIHTIIISIQNVYKKHP